MPHTSPSTFSFAGLPSRARRITKRSSFMAVALVGVVALGGCGSSDKPKYCSNVSKLESSVKALPGLAASLNLSGLQDQVTTIQAQAATLVSSAQNDFPTESSALTSSVEGLQSSIKALPSSPSVAQVAGTAANVSSVVNAVKGFTSATKSKCD